jgi:hypothetical protein
MRCIAAMRGRDMPGRDMLGRGRQKRRGGLPIFLTILARGPGVD